MKTISIINERKIYRLALLKFYKNLIMPNYTSLGPAVISAFQHFRTLRQEDQRKLKK